MGIGNRGALGRHDEIGAHRQFEAAGHGHAVQRSNHRFRKVAQPSKHRIGPVEKIRFAGTKLLPCHHFLQVRTRAEGLACTRNNQHAHLIVGRDFRQAPIQLGEEGEVHRVHRLRAIERQARDPVQGFKQQHVFGHADSRQFLKSNGLCSTLEAVVPVGRDRSDRA